MNDSPRMVRAPRANRIPVVLVVAVAVVIFLLTAAAIRQSQRDSYRLLVQQGVAFTEALAQASGNAIASEIVFDNLVQMRYSDLVTSLTELNLNTVENQDLVRFAQAHDLFAVYVFDSSSSELISATASGPALPLPEFVLTEIGALFAEPNTYFVLLTDQDQDQVEVVHYYLEISSQLDRVVVLSCDALYYSEVLRQTGIGYLAQSIAREQGVEYIIYQSTEGIIFSSRRPGELLAIESDPFLTQALETDTIVSRDFEFQESTVLELVRPFSTRRFPFGLFRVGLSLESYRTLSHRLLTQMIILAVILVCLILVIILYLNSRQKRQLLSREYSRIRTVTDRIFEQILTGVAVIDSDGKVRMANNALERICGLHDITGADWSTITAAKGMTALDPSEQTGSIGESEITLTVKGQEKSLLVATSRLVEEDSERAATVLVIYDITRLKEFEKTSARRERLSEMGNLAAGVAHEIRNPLNAISIAAQRLSVEFTPVENKEEYQSFTQQIRDETRRLNEIVTRFLALSREEARKRTSVRLDKLIDEVVGLLKVEAARMNIALDADVSFDLVLQADPDALKQVLRNLFNNSAESLEGAPGRILIEARMAGEKIRLVFSDSGPGISEEIRNKVFSPYFTTKQGGTGLGLPTVQKIVNDLRGEVELARSQWGGTSVVMTFDQQESP